MEKTEREAVAQKKTGGKRVQQRSTGRKPLAVIGLILALLLAAYVGLCAWASHSRTIWRDTYVLGQNLGGLTAEEAVEKINAALSDMEIGLYLYDGTQELAPDRGETPDAVIPLSALGADINVPELVSAAAGYAKSGSFLTAGWRYFNHAGLIYGGGQEISAADASALQAAAENAASSLSWEPEDTSFTVGDNALTVRMARDGRTVSASKILEGLERNYWSADLGMDIPYAMVSAGVLTARDIHDEAAAEMKNARYDAATQSIIPEQVGAAFDVDAAQALLDAAAPGETVTIPATMEYPKVTAEQLKAVLFRDVLGECRTEVKGTAARKSNVRLSSSTINGLVLNAGDVFSYNASVGQRTAARGYQPAPAYVQGETVDEIGGGICQTSSTLYLACLRGNLEITERYAHRYIPTYISPGMDATVSWGGPDYKFTNNTDYPVKIVTNYDGKYLTVKLLGTNVTGVSVKMTNEKLSTTDYEVVYEDDPTLAPGTEKVKTTPYTGSKWRTYRHLYDANGKLISSTLEATSNYKSRNKVILRGPAGADQPVSGGADIGTGTSGTGAGSGSAGGTTAPTTPTTPEVPTPEVPVTQEPAPEVPVTAEPQAPIVVDLTPTA